MEVAIKIFMIVSPLEQALNGIGDPPNLPRLLPFVHVTRVKSFRDIVARKELLPRTDDVFGEDLLHFFYGGVFYHCINKNLRDHAELPIAFLFRPSITNTFQQYFPFDSGAVEKMLDGDWKQKMHGFKDIFKVIGTDNRVPRRMVHHLFGNNEKYLNADPNSELLNGSDPLPLLHEFFSADLTHFGFDQRQCGIECQSRTPVKISEDLDWIGFPESYTDEVMELFDYLAPTHQPRYWRYPSPNIVNPAKVSHTLNQKAYEEAVKYIADLPNV